MNADEIMALEGVELSHLVADKVFGVQTRELPCPLGDLHRYICQCGHYYDACICHYHKAMEHAWDVVEKMRDAGYSFSQGYHDDWDNWIACFDRGDRVIFWGGDGVGEGETAPLAICRAALLAVMGANNE